MKCVLSLLAAAGLLFAGSETPAIPNFHQVDEHLFRGAQPAASDFQSLAEMGVKTVLDLREEGHSAAEEKLVEAAGMRYISLPLSGVAAPSDRQISRALDILEDSASGPVFVHCRRGADRTGTVVACSFPHNVQNCGPHEIIRYIPPTPEGDLTDTCARYLN